jgi:hypothetical protein
VLVVATSGASPTPPRRRRRRPRRAEPTPTPVTLPLSRFTAVRASESFDSEEDAARWLEAAVGAEEAIDALVAEGIDLVNRALHARAVAAADPRSQELDPKHAATVRIGYGSGEQVAHGDFAAAHEVDVRPGASAPRRRRRDDEVRPQERMAAVLGGRERLDACETLLLRARADLDSGRSREAALQLRAALEALLVELVGAVDDGGHERDMAELKARRKEADAAADAALGGELDDERARQVRELTEIAERVLRRRRILG